MGKFDNVTLEDLLLLDCLGEKKFDAHKRRELPKAGQIWRAKNGWERHVISSSVANISYIQVAGHGYKNVTRYCLPVTWARWLKKMNGIYVGEHRG